MSSLSIEARVGAFVLLAIVLLVGFVLALGDFTLSPGFTLFADFAYAGGLQEGAPIKVSGVRVGRVGKLSLLSIEAVPPPARPTHAQIGQLGSPVVRAELHFDEVARPLLNEGSRLAVGTQGLIGESYLELSPGTAPAALAEASAVRGIDAPDMRVLILQLTVIVDALGSMLATPTPTATAGPESVAAAFKNLLITADDVLGQHKGELSQTITDIASAAAELRAVLSEVHGALQGGQLAGVVNDVGESAALIKTELPELLAQTRTTLTHLDALAAAAQAAADPQALSSILADARAAAKNLELLTAGGQKLVARLERGEGSIGGLVNDPQVYDDLKELLRDLKRNPWKLFWRD